ncbi:MAG: UDP-glucose 4-epimerase GalE [Bacteriovoracia bacterium]
MTILVTGGAGYIGSHVLKELSALGEKVIVLDNLSTGLKEAILYGELVQGDVGDEALLDSLFSTHQFSAVFHFAGSIVVPESVTDPLKYYTNNTENSLKLLKAIKKHKTPHLIFSSTAAVYAMPADGVCREDSPLGPNNPYGTSKLMTEQMIKDFSASSNLRAVCLRYFNVAGADAGGKIGQSTKNASSLMKVVAECATGKRPQVEIFGTDYPTKDGTGVRDFIHVSDLASAHVKALEYLRKGGATTSINCGYGRGFTVREVIERMRTIAGTNFKVVESPRRAGDFAHIISNADRIRTEFGWEPKFQDLDVILRSALAWEKK